MTKKKPAKKEPAKKKKRPAKKKPGSRGGRRSGPGGRRPNPVSADELLSELFAFSMTLPGAHEDHPWGERVAKVDGKVFVFFGRGPDEDGRFGFSVKLPESGEQALFRPDAQPTGYGLGRSGWVSFRFAPGDAPPVDDMLAWVEESYRAVARKGRVKELDSRRIENA